MTLEDNNLIGEYPIAGCKCLAYQEARMEGKQEWIEPETIFEAKDGSVLDNVYPIIFEPKKQRPKHLAFLRRGRLGKWAKKDELRQAQATKKVSTAILFFLLSLIVIYFGFGVYHGLKN